MVEPSRLATNLSVAGALTAFLSLCIAPWVTKDSDTRTWYGFYVIMTYPDLSAVNVPGWVVGVVFCVAIAAVLLVLVATRSRVVRAGLRISAVVGAGLPRRSGLPPRSPSQTGTTPCTWRSDPGSWLGVVLVSVVVLKPSIGSVNHSASEVA